jgi:hypothetical protein
MLIDPTRLYGDVQGRRRSVRLLPARETITGIVSRNRDSGKFTPLQSENTARHAAGVMNKDL